MESPIGLKKIRELLGFQSPTAQAKLELEHVPESLSRLVTARLDFELETSSARKNTSQAEPSQAYLARLPSLIIELVFIIPIL